MDVIWYLSVKIKSQQKVLWFCIASLRIYYVILFECEGPWMLIADSLIF